MATYNLTAERLRELLHYDPGTGVFTWKTKPSRNRLSGDIAGSIGVGGYRLIRINRVAYRAHNLAWMYETGALPENILDHINGDPGNNRFCNLRPATSKQNAENRRIGVTNKSGFRGVSFHKMTGKFRANVGHFGKKFHLGLFDSAKEAAEVARAKRLAIFTHNMPDDLMAQK